MIAVIDYGVINLGTMLNMLHRIKIIKIVSACMQIRKSVTASRKSKI